MLDTSVKFRLARRTSDSCGVLDVVDWKTRMADLQGIMSCAKALYLLLETHHEAIVRVALELALEPEVRRIFAWENWYQESQRREGFRQKVQEKLQRVFRMLDIQAPAAEQWPTPGREKQERHEVVSIQRSRAKSREDKEVQADDGERARLQEQLEALLKERSQQIQQQELQKVQEVQRSPEREQDLKELEQLRQAKRQFEEQQREMEFLKEVQKRFEQQQLEVLRLEQAQRQSADGEELQKMRQAQAAFEKQSADLKKLREEHAAALHRANTLEAEQKQMQEEIHKKNTAMKEMQTKLQGFVQETEEIGAETEAVIKRLMKKVGLTDEVIRTELVWVRLYRDAMERLQRAAARREEKKQEAREKERELKEAQSPENAWEEFVAETKAVHAAPLGAWLPGRRTPSASPTSRHGHGGASPSSCGSPKRRAFLEPETSQVQILQAPRRCVRKLQNSRSAPAIPR